MDDQLRVWQPGGTWPDPHLWVESRSNLNIRFAVFEGLVGYDAHLNIVARLASSWEVSEDAREWAFTLRENVCFHDGTPLRASDAVASIRNASRADIGGAYGTNALLYSYLGNARLEVLDELRFRVKLDQPMADLPDLLVYIMIIPEKSIGTAPETIPGTGLYCLDTFEVNRITLKRSKAKQDPAVPSVLQFTAEKDAAKRAAALLNGEADIVTELEWPQTTGIDAGADAAVIEYHLPVAIPLILNCFTGPFTDVRVRQAVNYGTDVDEIIQKACGGTAVKLTGPLTPHHFGYDRHAKHYPYDTKKAWQLLAEAGYAEGLELTMYRPAVMPNEAGAVAKCLKEQWARIGIKLHIEVQPDREQYSQDVRAKKIRDLCIFDSAPLSTYRVLHEKLDSTVRGPWWQGYESPSFNRLLATAARTVDRDARRKLYTEAIQLCTEEAPWVFLYSPIRFFALTWDIFDQYPGLCQRVDGLISFL